MFQSRCVLQRDLALFKPSPGTRYASKSIHKIFAVASMAELIGEARSVESGVPKLHGLPEVIVAGRANSGKSSLLNAVLGREGLVETSSKAGRTRTLRFYRVGPVPGSLVLVDAPGYGARGRPEWGRLFDDYISTRKELKRIYVLFNAKHGLNQDDQSMLQNLDQRCQSTEGQTFTLQAIVTKLDLLTSVSDTSATEQLQKIQTDIFEAAPTCLPPIFTSTVRHPYLGIQELRRSILEACGTERVRSVITHNQ